MYVCVCMIDPHMILRKQTQPSRSKEGPPPLLLWIGRVQYFSSQVSAHTSGHRTIDFQKYFPGTLTLNGLSAGTRCFMLVYLFARIICQWFLFTAGASYTVLSPDKDTTIGNLLNIMLVDNFEDVVCATLLPKGTKCLMTDVVFGHAIIHGAVLDTLVVDDEEADKENDELVADRVQS